MKHQSTGSTLTLSFFQLVCPTSIISHVAATEKVFVVEARVVHHGNHNLSLHIDAFVIVPTIFRSVDAETYEKFTDAERENYDNAQKAMSEDKALQKNYAMVFSLSLVILSISIFLAIFSTEFLIPLWLGNGQTVGKKVFGICLMRIDGVRVSRLSLFARAVLGKYTIETMIPILILMMFMFGVIGFVGTVVLLMLLGLQIGVMIYTNTNSMIHDLFASTVVVDMASQMIFDSPEALLAYKEKVAAEYAEHHER